MMAYLRTFMLATWPVLFVWGLGAYTLGQSSVRVATKVESGFPFYAGVFFGECAWEGEPYRSRQFCATDTWP